MFFFSFSILRRKSTPNHMTKNKTNVYMTHRHMIKITYMFLSDINFKIALY